MSRLKCLNAISTWECTRLDLLLPLSLTGHDALVKIYVFMQSKSQIVYQAISSFIWNKGPIRIWNALWEMSKASGIILLGNKYVHGILHWPRCHYNIERLPIWVQLEETWCRAMPLMKLACALLSKSSFNLIIVLQLVKYCEYGDSLNATVEFKQFQYFLPVFLLSLNDNAFWMWHKYFCIWRSV